MTPKEQLIQQAMVEAMRLTLTTRPTRGLGPFLPMVTLKADRPDLCDCGCGNLSDCCPHWRRA